MFYDSLKVICKSKSRFQHVMSTCNKGLTIIHKKSCSKVPLAFCHCCFGTEKGIQPAKSSAMQSPVISKGDLFLPMLTTEKLAGYTNVE